jgi:hypothetical protein
MGAFTDSGTRHQWNSFRSYNVTTKSSGRLIFDRKHGIASEMGPMLETSSPCFVAYEACKTTVQPDFRIPARRHSYNRCSPTYTCTHLANRRAKPAMNGFAKVIKSRSISTNQLTELPIASGSVAVAPTTTISLPSLHSASAN